MPGKNMLNYVSLGSFFLLKDRCEKKTKNSFLFLSKNKLNKRNVKHLNCTFDVKDKPCVTIFREFRPDYKKSKKTTILYQ